MERAQSRTGPVEDSPPHSPPSFSFLRFLQDGGGGSWPGEPCRGFALLPPWRRRNLAFRWAHSSLANVCGVRRRTRNSYYSAGSSLSSLLVIYPEPSTQFGGRGTGVIKSGVKEEGEKEGLHRAFGLAFSPPLSHQRKRDRRRCCWFAKTKAGYGRMEGGESWKGEGETASGSRLV